MLAVYVPAPASVLFDVVGVGDGGVVAGGEKLKEEEALVEVEVIAVAAVAAEEREDGVVGKEGARATRMSSSPHPGLRLRLRRCRCRCALASTAWSAHSRCARHSRHGIGDGSGTVLPPASSTGDARCCRGAAWRSKRARGGHAARVVVVVVFSDSDLDVTVDVVDLVGLVLLSAA